MTFAKWLEEVGACKAARDWVGNHGLLWAYKNCTRPHWMLWVLEMAYHCETWPTSFDLSQLWLKLYDAGFDMDVWCATREDSRQYPRMCDFIRAHVKPGTVSNLTRRFEEEMI